MSKKTSKQKAITGGPYLASAVFCDSIVEGADKTLSAIRIIDRVTLKMPSELPAGTSDEDFKMPVMIRALISFRTGYSKGKHDIHFVMHSPGGKKQAGPKQRLEFGKEPNSGANLNIGFTLLVNKGGLFWFDVVLDGKVVTRMPLAITTEKEKPSPEQSAPKVAKTARKKRPS